MFQRIKRFFAPKTLFVEVEPLRHTFTADDEAMVRSLASHGGWRVLMAKLDVQRRALESVLRQPHDTLRDYDRIQLGIQWVGWLDRQVREAVAAEQRRKSSAPTDLEAEAVKAAAAGLQLVGRDV